MKTFFDSSAFAKRFVDESGSDDVEALCDSTTALGLSVLCVPEILSALNRRLREGTLVRRQYAMAKRRLFEDIRDAEIVNLTGRVVMSSVDVLEESPVRAMDALHIACALEWRAELFVSADLRQLRAAEMAGLTTHRT